MSLEAQHRGELAMAIPTVAVGGRCRRGPWPTGCAAAATSRSLVWLPTARAGCSRARAGNLARIAKFLQNFVLGRAILKACLIAMCWAGRWNRAVLTHSPVTTAMAVTPAFQRTREGTLPARQ